MFPERHFNHGLLGASWRDFFARRIHSGSITRFVHVRCRVSLFSVSQVWGPLHDTYPLLCSAGTGHRGDSACRWNYPTQAKTRLEWATRLGRNPSESELKVMNLKTIRQMTGWDSPSANATEYFAAALLARLAISQKIEPPERAYDFMNLSFLAAAESMAAFKLYIELLGARVVSESSDARAQKTRRTKGRRLSRLFK